MSMDLRDFLKNFSESYSVHRFEDIESGVLMNRIKDDVYLVKNAEVKE